MFPIIMVGARRLAAVWAVFAWSLSLAGAGETAPRDTFRWAGWQIPGQTLEERGMLAIVEDEEAESVRRETTEDGQEQVTHVALQQRVSRRSIAKQAMHVAKTPTVMWEEAVPGLYRVTARVKMDGDLGLIGTPIGLHMDESNPKGRRTGQRIGRSWNAPDFEATETDGYVELSFLYEFDRDARRLPARTAYSPWQCRRYYREVYPDALAMPEANSDKSSAGICIVLTLPQTKYSSMTGMPPNSLRSLSLDWIKLERVQPSPSLTIRYVRPKLLWLRPGMEQRFTLALQNFTAAAHTRTVALVLESGLDRRETIHTAEVTLPAGGTRTLDIPWPTTDDTPLYGYRVVAEVRDGETVEYAADDVFQIHPRCYDVHVGGARSRAVDPFREPESYRNHLEQYGSLPGDCSRIMPQGEHWTAGMLFGGQAFDMAITKAAVAHNASEGIATFLYLFSGGTGQPAMDMYVEHPEYASSRVTATDVMYRKLAERNEEVRNHDWTQGPPPPSEGVPHIETGLNHIFPELKAKIEREAVAFVQATGFNGIRFDVGMFSPKRATSILGEPLNFDMADAHAKAAENFTDFRARLREVDPHFEFGANMDSWSYLKHVGKRDTTPPPVETYKEFLAFANAHGMFMDEDTMGAPLYDHYLNRWEDLFWGLAQKRHTAARHGGIYETFSPHRDPTGHFCHDDIYTTIAALATGSHYVGNFAPVPFSETGGVGPFICRFSEFFWDIELRPLDTAGEDIFVDAMAEVWYADTAMRRNLPDGGERWVVPLVNPPVVDRLRRNKINELPPPLESFTVELTAPEGATGATAWMLTWEPRPAAVRLKSDFDGDVLEAELPGLRLCRTLVVEWKK